jgi:hypothetical protein
MWKNTRISVIKNSSQFMCLVKIEILKMNNLFSNFSENNNLLLGE